MKIGSKVAVVRADFDQETGLERNSTVGQGLVKALTTSFVRVYGADGDITFDEFFPIRSRRLWVTVMG